MPEIAVPLGLQLGGLSIGQLLKRLNTRLSVVAANRSELNFLTEADAAMSARLETDEDGEVIAKIEIPPDPTTDLVGHPRDPRHRRAAMFLLRADAAEQASVDRVKAAVEANARVAAEVAAILNTEPRADLALRRLEETEGVSTTPFRQFHYWQQGDFAVEFDDRERIAFRPEVIRADFVREAGVKMEFAPTPSDPTSAVDIQGRVIGTQITQPGFPGIGGGKQKFRFVATEGWQRALLRAADELGLVFQVQANILMAACTLRCRVHEVTSQVDWHELLLGVLAALPREVRAGAKERLACDVQMADQEVA